MDILEDDTEKLRLLSFTGIFVEHCIYLHNGINDDEEKYGLKKCIVSNRLKLDWVALLITDPPQTSFNTLVRKRIFFYIYTTYDI